MSTEAESAQNIRKVLYLNHNVVQLAQNDADPMLLCEVGVVGFRFNQTFYKFY